MKTHWLVTMPVSLTLLLIFMIFVPVDCTFPIPNCAWSSVAQYESISYAYGGWGAVFQTGPDKYYIAAWTPPFAQIFWTVIALLVLTDVLSTVIITRRLTGRKSPPKLTDPQKGSRNG